MAFTKPSTINSLWATSGTRTPVPSSKRSLGWIAEKPPYQYFNDILYKLGQANAYFNSRGSAEWDDETEYVGEKSYIVGSDGSLYKCLVDNTNQNPVLDDGTYWKLIANGQGSESWNILFPYEVGALVLHDSELWLAAVDSTGSEPTDVNTDWDKLIRKSELDALDARVSTNEGDITSLEDSQFGIGQTRQSFTIGTERVSGETYENLTNRPIEVFVIFGDSAGGAVSADIVVGGVNIVPSIIYDSGTGTGVFPATFTVLPNESYTCTISGASLVAWSEIR